MMAGLWQPELQTLLDILGSAPSPVGSAVRWVESHGQSGVGCNRAGLGSLWRLVPDVLAKEVVFHEEAQEQPVAEGTVGNCLWLQTLPFALQANILIFLATEHVRFRLPDLKFLAHRLLNSGEMGYWVRRAAQTLLATTFGSTSSSPAELEDAANQLPQFLEGQGSMFGYLPVRCSGSKNSMTDQTVDGQGDPQVGDTETTRTKNCQLDFVGPDNPQSDAHLVRTPYPESTCIALDQPLCPASHVACRPSQATANQPGAQDAEEKILGSDLFNRAISLKEAFTSNPLGAGDMQGELELFRITPDVSVLLKVLKPWEFDDDVTLLLVGSLVGDQEGYAWSTQMMSSLLLPKLQDLKQPASRVLLMALIQAAKAQPRASVDSIVLPLLRSEAGASPLQCEVINRVIKDCLTTSSASLLLGKLFDPDVKQHSGVIRLSWTEAMVGVLQNLLDSRGLCLEEDVTSALVFALQGVADQFAGSLKFGNLLLNLATKHGAQLNASHVKLLQQVASRTTTFLSNSLMSKLNKL